MIITDSTRVYSRSDVLVVDYTCGCDKCMDGRNRAAHGAHIILVVPPCVYHDAAYTAEMVMSYPLVQLVEQVPLALQ